MFPGVLAKLVCERAPMIDDGHGNLVANWPAAAAHDVEGCSIQPGATSEDLQHRDGSLIAYTVWAPIDADVLSSDRILLYGEPFTINGEIIRWATGILDHTVIFLQRWEG